MNEIKKIYNILLKEYRSQGWWPIVDIKSRISVYNKNFSKRKRTKDEQFEICIGAILTQSTSWKNVEKALLALKISGSLNKEKLKSISSAKLANLIKSAGYFNQKAKKIKSFIKYKEKISREGLLTIWGCGNETVDSMLLYAYNQPVFVIDAYTRRIMSRLKLCKENTSYEELQNLFHQNLKKDYSLFNEYHALLVEHAKQYCRVKPLCNDCPLRKMCLR